MDIDILIDLPSRELVVASYVARALTHAAPAMAVSTDLHGDFNKGTRYDFFERTREPRALIVTPSYNVRRTANVLARAVRQRAVLVHQHSEQLFPAIFDNEKLNINQSASYRRHIRGHLVWGAAFARKLVDAVGIDPERIFITGNPKLDLARRVNARQGTAMETRPVLFASNFTLADLSDSGWQAFKVRYGVDTEFPLHRAYAEMRRQCCDWLLRAATTFPDVVFNIRPHPGETATPYDQLNDLPNVEVDGQGDFSTALANCSLLLCYSSTSIFEARACGIPAYRLDVGHIPAELAQPPQGIFPWVSELELHKLLHIQRTGEALPAAPCLGVDEYMYRPTGNSLLRTAIAIYEMARRTANRTEVLGVRDKLLGLAYHVPPLAKDIALRASAGMDGLFGVSSRMYRRTQGVFTQRSASGEIPSEGELAAAHANAGAMLTPAEIQVLSEGNYVLRSTDAGTYIDLPDWLEEAVPAATCRKTVAQAELLH